MEEFTEQEKERLAANPHAHGHFLGALNLPSVSNQLGEPARLVLYSRALTVVALPDDRVVGMLSESEKFSSAQILLEILNEWKTQNPEEAREDVRGLAKLETHLSGWQANYAVTAAAAERAAPYGPDEPYEASQQRKKALGKKGKKLRRGKLEQLEKDEEEMLREAKRAFAKKKGGRKRRRSRRKSRRSRKSRRKRRRKRRKKTRRRRKRRR